MVYDADLLDLRIIAEQCRQWAKGNLISKAQFKKIVVEIGVEPRDESLPMSFGYFAAATLIFFGVFGISLLIFRSPGFATTLTGIGGVIYLETYLAGGVSRYFSGISTAACWLSCLFLLSAVALTFGSQPNLIYLYCAALTWIYARRYLSSVAIAVSLVFALLAMTYPLIQLEAPPVIVLTIIAAFFSSLCFASIRMRSNPKNRFFYDQLRMMEFVSLIIVALAGNRLCASGFLAEFGTYGDAAKLSSISPALWLPTLIIPAVYLYWAIKSKDIGLIRVALILIGLSAFTVKYFYSLSDPEITLTAAGFLLLLIAIALNWYLREMRNGFTRKKILEEAWINPDGAAIIVAQTVSDRAFADQAPKDYRGSGGGFSGGGSSGEY